MAFTPQDRIALLLGRAIIRAETLTVALEQAQARITELEASQPPIPPVSAYPKETP